MINGCDGNRLSVQKDLGPQPLFIMTRISDCCLSDWFPMLLSGVVRVKRGCEGPHMHALVDSSGRVHLHQTFGMPLLLAHVCADHESRYMCISARVGWYISSARLASFLKDASCRGPAERTFTDATHTVNREPLSPENCELST